ncbi:MAG: hypothetical protein LBI05_10770 [Planctomycetaceae bacterium]|jgi:hypothetical protein|nr:hypothetical protein [Planctomycetaceae bacterium]
MRILSTVFAVIFSTFSVLADDTPLPEKIQRVDLILHSHTDIGYTDHPLITRIRQMQYLDIAIDAVLATEKADASEKFYWTAEAGHCLADWWREASTDRRNDLIRAVQTGRLEVTAFAMNQTPLMNAKQWDVMTFQWLPEEVRKAAKIKAGMQNDVNGCPRAGALRLLDNDVPYLWMSINGFNGGAPLPQPSAFWWKMPDGRKLFVWLNLGYGDGFYFFHDYNWRQGPVPESTDTRYRPPREGDFFCADEDFVRNSHRHLCERLRGMEANGYQYPSLPMSFTNQWRIDNDPPFPDLPKFAATWQRLNLKPELRLTTAASALESLRTSIGDSLPEYEGEFTDWWANGSASAPREIAAARQAKRLLAAAASPVFGPMTESAMAKETAILRELCFFDEHTWGSVDSVGRPHDLDVLGQYNEKSRYAYHAAGLAKLFLSQRAGNKYYREATGYHLVNTAPEPWSGWVNVPATALREHLEALRDVKSNRLFRIERRHGFASFSRAHSPDDISPESDQGTIADNVPDNVVRFWVDNLPGRSALHLVRAEPKDAELPKIAAPSVKTDEHGWLISAQWGDRVLFDRPPGGFVSVEFTKFNGRWLYGELNGSNRTESLSWKHAEPAGMTTVEETPYTICYTQPLKHSRLKWLTRTLEIEKATPKARLTVRLYRTSSELPEWFFIGSSLAVDGEVMPLTSCGGVPFTPFTDQLPGTCRDYFGIDSWVAYPSGDEQRIWISRDAPLITFGERPEPLLRRNAPPEMMNSIYAMVYDNTWLTNFLCDQHGVMEFRFDLVLRQGNDSVMGLAETILSEPVFINNAELKEAELYMKHLHQP